jgi:hypothetical protein
LKLAEVISLKQQAVMGDLIPFGLSYNTAAQFLWLYAIT